MRAEKEDEKWMQKERIEEQRKLHAEEKELEEERKRLAAEDAELQLEAKRLLAESDADLEARVQAAMADVEAAEAEVNVLKSREEKLAHIEQKWSLEQRIATLMKFQETYAHELPPKELEKIRARIATLRLQAQAQAEAALIEETQRAEAALKRERQGQVTALFGKKLVDSAADGKLHQVRKILEHSARQVDLDHVSDNGDTALQAACKNGHHELVAFLLEEGARPDTPLWAENSRSALCHAVAFGGDDDSRVAMRMVKALINHDVSLHETSIAEGDLTPLHIAALAGRHHIVKVLVLAGASPAIVWLDTHRRQLLPADIATGECIGMPELSVDIGLHEDPPLVGPSSASTSADFDFEVSSALGERVLRGKPVSKPLGRTRV